MSRRLLVFAVLLALPATVEAQNSVYGTRGIGFPGRPLSVRSRAVGGGWGIFDNYSMLNPAATASFTALSVNAVFGLTLRNYSIDTTSVTGLRENRFPHAILGGNLGRSPLSFSVGFSTYAERSFSLNTLGMGEVEGVPVEVRDRISSDGGIVDARAALGWRVSPNVSLGGAFHVINGSSRIQARRDFINRDLITYDIASDLSFSGVGLSAGIIVRSTNGRTQVGLAGRWDDRLTSEIDNRAQGDIDLPVSLSGGVSLVVSPTMRWSTSATWRGWSVSDAELSAGSPASPVRAFDTWDVGSGVELGGLTARFPARLGLRYATLPFGASGKPHEIVLSAGTGSRFAAGRGRLDVTLERLIRDGAGASERGWHVTVGVTVQP